MPWYIYAIGCAIAITIASLLEKKVLAYVPSAELTMSSAVVNTVLTIPVFFLVPMAGFRPATLIFLFFATMLAVPANLFAMKAFRHLEISVFQPLMSLHPIFTGVSAFLFLGEGFTRVQFCGVGLAVLGAYILETRPHHSLFDPLRQFLRSKYIHLAFFVLLIHAITALVDRTILGSTSIRPFAYVAVAQCFLLFHFALYTLLFRDGVELFRRGFAKARWWLLPISVCTVAGRVLQSAATKLAYVGLVIAVKHTASFFSTLIGGELFHEKNLGRKIAASAIIIGGVILIVLSGS